MATTSLTLSGYRNNRATGAAARWSASPLRDDVTFWVDAIGYGCTTDHTTISSRTDSLDRMDAVALAFHEGAQVIVHELQRAFKSCEEQKKDCGDPWHAVQFYTLGELMKGELPKQNIDCTLYPLKIRRLSVGPMDEVPDRDRKGLEAGSRTSRGSRVSMKA